MTVLLGREDETARLEALLAGLGRGEGGALLLHGEPGIGKSALLDRLASGVGGPADLLVLRASGVEFETELPYAALHQLCGPVLSGLPALPPPHRAALEIAFGIRSGSPDPFLVGAACLGLLVEVGRPVLCVIDDAHWLDDASARALAFVARRLGAEQLAMVFAAREELGRELAGLPRLPVGRLDESRSRTLLHRALGAPLDPQVAERILAEARGNPLALLELPTTAALAGGFRLPEPAGAVEQSFRARLAGLGPADRLALALAAAEPLGDPALLWRAAERLGITEAVGGELPLVEIGTRVRFVHPLARSAAYQGAPLADRRRAHAALAEVSDPVADPDRVAWHRAQASVGPDEEVAAALEDSAHRASARGGVAAAAAFLERAAGLTLDPGRRSSRVLAAAEAKLSLGEFDVAAELLGTVDPEEPRADLLRGRISFARHRGDRRPTEHLLRAAGRLSASDPDLARACYLEAVETGVLTGGLAEVLAAVRTVPGGDPVLAGMVALADQGHVAAGPLAAAVADPRAEVWARRPTLGYLLAVEFWDAEAMHGIAARFAAAGRGSGAFHLLPIGLAMLAVSTAYRGDFGAAMAMISEEESIAEATGAAPLVYPRIHLTALRGRRAEAEELFGTLGPHMSLSVHYARAVLGNGHADYPAALAAARAAVATGDLGLSGLALPELIEAAVRCGEHDAARSALGELEERAQAGGRPWGLGVAAYARALVTDEGGAYREAVAILEDEPQVVHRGRALLLHGEWLRRQGQRAQARIELRRAHELFSATGAAAFAERAARELTATGEHARSRTAPASDTLTMQEVHIARLVADGATSKEVAATLFLSPRTVDAHLRNIFRKLGLTSRRQLRDLPAIR
ncbi:LuxR family transcriptional regulator [Longispora fulva]|uniref:DNA-binding CsgD family transcriptional regulator n=1 Tax=Longispora fulva TaxID=619741 RepID=A0A8J7GH50_9ACTN|nr:LuxR family transcriptional regulator [Longispora fulva]MBG6136103.1 DNA-binding CsgD family transcriptional regulator [Longispora fulva]GIG55652.1 LuxR family transcriptional regulator [Longispora fulva]